MRRHFGFPAKREHQWHVPLAKRHLPPSTERYTHWSIDLTIRAIILAAIAAGTYGIYLGAGMMVTVK